MLKNLKILLCIVYVSLAAEAQALVVLQQFTVPVGIEYDSNPNLLPEDEESVWRYTTTPTYTVSGVEDRNKWYSTLGLRLQRSSDKRLSVDREDPIVTVGWDRELERGAFKFFGNYERSSIRATQLRRTGLVEADGDQTTKSLNAEWTRLLTERLSFSLAGKLLATDFSVGDAPDYENYGVDSSIGYVINEKVNTFVRVSYLKYKPDDNFKNVSSQNYIGGFTVELSPSLSFLASAGWNHLTDAENTFIANTAIKYVFDKHQLNGSLERFIDAGNGLNQRSERFAAGYIYQLNDRSKLGSNFSWQKNSFINANPLFGTIADNNVMNLGGYYTREITERWILNVSAEHVRQRVDNLGTANSDIAGITFVYSTPQF